ncbi:MAG: hypothetical protein ABIA76_05635 [Candidatus Diapherotrites archaeon]
MKKFILLCFIALLLFSGSLSYNPILFGKSNTAAIDSEMFLNNPYFPYLVGQHLELDLLLINEGEQQLTDYYLFVVIDDFRHEPQTYLVQHYENVLIPENYNEQFTILSVDIPEDSKAAEYAFYFVLTDSVNDLESENPEILSYSNAFALVEEYCRRIDGDGDGFADGYCTWMAKIPEGYHPHTAYCEEGFYSQYLCYIREAVPKQMN